MKQITFWGAATIAAVVGVTLAMGAEAGPQSWSSAGTNDRGQQLRAQHRRTTGGWVKYEGNPIMGGKYGTCFDISVLREGGPYRMWLSWRPKRSLALVDSKDGIHWSEPPQIVLGPRDETGWEDDINRPVVLKRQDGYHLWYTGQAKGHSSIGYATSANGITWKRMSDRPVLVPEMPWEKVAVMCPHVLWDASGLEPLRPRRHHDGPARSRRRRLGPPRAAGARLAQLDAHHAVLARHHRDGLRLEARRARLELPRDG